MFKKHLPGSVDGVRTKWEVNTLEEVLALDYIKRWSDKPNFYMWAKDDNTLMALLDGGKVWWVIGYADFKLDLPEWKDHYIPKEMQI